MAHVPSQLLPILALASLLGGCIEDSVYSPVRPEKSSFRVYHLGTYSSKLAEEEREAQGTLFQTTLSYQLEKIPGTQEWTMRRRLDTLVAKGFHKLSMPHELEKKVDLDFRLDSAFIPVRIDGYDSLKALLARIEQKNPAYRTELLAATDTAYYRAWNRDWWRLLGGLPKGVQLKRGQSLPVEDLNKALETVKLDSGHYDGLRFRGTRSGNKRNCLEYTYQYHRTDSLPLLVEQFFFSGGQNRKYRKYTWNPGPVRGSLQFSVDGRTGLPCFHARTEIGDIKLADREAKSEVPIKLFRYEEDIYEH